MKHKPNCMGYLCTCGLKEDLAKLEEGLSVMKEHIEHLEKLVEVHDAIWPNKVNLTPEDVQFMKKMNKRKDDV